MERQTLEEILEKHLPETELRETRKLLYGCEPEVLELPQYEKNNNLEVKGFKIGAIREQLRPPRIVRVGIIQHLMPVPATCPIQEQRNSLFQKISGYVAHAAACKVNILCLQEIWAMPYVFCTREKYPWCEFAEDAEYGPTVTFVSKLAMQNNMVIVCPILERDSINGETIWNTAVVIETDGRILGKHRKNHIPRMCYNESAYYESGNLGHPVFETSCGKIGVVICYARLHPLNWLMQGLNGAEIVFCPSAAIGDMEESLWPIHGRCEAVANSFFTCNINRVGTEEQQNEFTLGDGKKAYKHFGHFWGSSYIAAPDGSRTPSLGRHGDGLLIAELDLNLCRQAKDTFGLRMTRRLDHYVPLIVEASKKDFKPQVVRK